MPLAAYATFGRRLCRKRHTPTRASRLMTTPHPTFQCDPMTSKSSLLRGCAFAITALALSACATSSTLTEEVQPHVVAKKDRGTFPFIGEKLVFDARHVATKASIADAILQVGHESTMEDGTRFIPISGHAASKSIIRLFARVDDSTEAYIDPQSWETLYGYKHLDENTRDREYSVLFWPRDLTASVERHNAGNIVKRDYAIPNGTMDSIVWVYEMRASNLEQGKSYTRFTFDGWTLNKVELKVLGEEDVWTENGFYHCQKYEIWRERSDAIEPRGALSGLYIDPERNIYVKPYLLATAWLAKDEAKTPVRMVVSTGIGDFDLLLKSVSKE